METDVRGRQSAVPLGAGNVSTSVTRNRSRVMFAPVLLVQVRLTESVPNVELFGGSEVKSRAKLTHWISAGAAAFPQWEIVKLRFHDKVLADFKLRFGSVLSFAIWSFHFMDRRMIGWRGVERGNRALEIFTRDVVQDPSRLSSTH